MSHLSFREMLEEQWAKGNFISVGLDVEFNRIPVHAYRHGKDFRLSVVETIVEFNRTIVKATWDRVCAYKLNYAFYAIHGAEGITALHETILNIHTCAPDVPVILDSKWADTGNTNVAYVKASFEYLQADAVTVSPYLGPEALQPFLNRKDRGIIVLCHTSDPGADEFQDLHTLSCDPKNKPEGLTAQEWLKMLCDDSMRLYERVAHDVSTKWNKNGNCALVVGATYTKELRRVREIVGDMPILIPGIGAQGGDVEATVSAGKDSHGQGMILHSSRGIIFASSDRNFADAARRETEKLRNSINQYR